MAKLFGCACRSKKIADIKCLNFKNYDLLEVPVDAFLNELTLEELYVDDNKITQLRKELFCCHGLQKLSLSHNKISEIPVAIGNLYNLVELNVSKNYLVEIPENIKQCKYLQVIDLSDNALVSIPDALTSLRSLTHLSINVCMLESLPGSLGRLTSLRVLEVRENKLIEMPSSLSRLKCLERLDLGCNQIESLHDGLGSLTALAELWLDSNKLSELPSSIGHLQQLMFLDVSNNQLQHLPAEIDGCVALSDLNLSENMLEELPDSIGRLTSLNNLRLDVNHLTSLPFTLGGLAALNEFNASSNQLRELPASIGLLRRLRTFHCDSNQLTEVPRDLGSCTSITVLSLRHNQLTTLPEEMGHMAQLRVLNLSNNRLQHLPVSFLRLRQLQALWLSDNQSEAQPSLQSEFVPERGVRVLTCFLLPQMPAQPLNLVQRSDSGPIPERRRFIQFDIDSDHESHHGSLPKDASTSRGRSRRPLPSRVSHLLPGSNRPVEQPRSVMESSRFGMVKPMPPPVSNIPAGFTPTHGMMNGNFNHRQSQHPPASGYASDSGFVPRVSNQSQSYQLQNDHGMVSYGRDSGVYHPRRVVGRHANEGYLSDSADQGYRREQVQFREVSVSDQARHVQPELYHMFHQRLRPRTPPQVTPPQLPPRAKASNGAVNASDHSFIVHEERPAPMALPEDTASTDSGYGHPTQLLPQPPGRSPPPPPQLHNSPPVSGIRVHAMRGTSQHLLSISPSEASDAGCRDSGVASSLPAQLHLTRMERYSVQLLRNPSLGFSITGGIDTDHKDVFVTQVNPHGPAVHILQSGDKILSANNRSFTRIAHQAAVQWLKGLPQQVDLIIEREVVLNHT